VTGEIHDGGRDALLAPLPSGAAQLGELRIRLGAADILLHQLDLRRRHIDARALAEFEDEMLFGLSVMIEHLHAAIAGDAMADVHDEIALLQLEETVDGAGFELAAWLHRAGLIAMEQLVIAKHHDVPAGRDALGPDQAEPRMDLPDDEPQPLGLCELPGGQHVAELHTLR